MTAAEKAKELVDKFESHSFMDIDLRISAFESAKQCAKICVEEILAYHHSLFDAGLGQVSQTLTSKKFVYNDVMNPQEKYLKYVLNEIEKL